MLMCLVRWLTVLLYVKPWNLAIGPEELRHGPDRKRAAPMERPGRVQGTDSPG